MALPSSLTHLAEAWSSVYDNHRAVSVGVLFFHLAGIVLGGGAALVADRRILAAAAGKADRAACLAELPGVHRVVLRALALVVISGALLTLSDLEAFVASRVFYLKLALVALLLLNGLGLIAGERALRRGDEAGGWRTLRLTAGASSVLWLAILLVGVWLTKAA